MLKPDQFSHSQISSWMRCGKQYYLERIVGYRHAPAVYLATGNAMHEVIEELNRKHFARQQRRVSLDRSMPTDNLSA